MLDYAAVVLAVFVASVISGLGGFGGALIIIVVLTPIVGAKGVVPLIAVYAVFSNVSRIIVYRKTIDYRLAAWFTAASLPGVYVGANFLAVVPERALVAFIGAILIVTIPARRYLKRRSFEPGVKTIIGFGLTFGFISGAAAGTGLLAIAALLNMGLQGPLLLGTDAAIGIVNASSRVISYWSLDLLDRDLFVLGLLMGVASFPGTWIASLIVRHIGIQLHGQLMEILLIAGGVWFLYKAVFSPFSSSS